MHKSDYANAAIKANALSANRNDWKNILLKIIELKQDPMDVYSLLSNPSNVAFLENYANTEGKDGQACAQAILRFVFDIEHEYPRPLPIIGNGGGRNSATKMETNEILNQNITVFPNPTNNKITIVNSLNNSDGLILEIKDLLGKTIYTNFIRTAKSNISMSEFENGVYILTLSKVNKTIVYRSKIIKQD